VSGEAATPADAFLSDLAAQAAAADREGRVVVPGRDGWLFFVPELRSLGAGRFWGADARQASRSPSPEYADPLPAILDFHAQLARAGVELLFVPVPAKAAIYPEMISEAGKDGGRRLDPYHEEFYRVLRKAGLAVLDLTPAFLAHRRTSAAPLYCRQDTHWSGDGIALAARLIAEAVRERKWLAHIPKRRYDVEEREVEITGDLWQALGDPSAPKERLRLGFVRERGTNTPPQPWRESPVVLLGDSHGLVFHGGGDMHAQGAGLADHLAHRLGFPVDLVAVRGSGATPSRLSLARRRDNMRGKRLVVWCLSVREFTEGQGWRKVPVVGAGKP
jgi:alginate O-acetyltransferase complex protein AlgJ